MIKDLDYFLSRTVNVGSCKEWTKCFNTDGYPRSVINGNSNGKVHREVFFLFNGYYPPVVRHTCDNPKCINPEHLIGGGPVDNVNDCLSRGRFKSQVFEEDKQVVLALRNEGFTMKQIAEKLNINWKRVDYILSKIRKESEG